jgi:hypothetical protein
MARDVVLYDSRIRPPRKAPGVVDVARIEAALHKVARLMDFDDAYAPIFLRLEDELEKAKAAERSGPIARARAMRAAAAKTQLLPAKHLRVAAWADE